MHQESKLTVYYNSACPVCEAGICYQRKLMSNQNVAWIDIHTQTDEFNQSGLDLERVREQLHVLDADGNLLIGDLALASLWQRTPRQRMLAQIVKYARFITKPAYILFAKCLYRWNRYRGHW